MNRQETNATNDLLWLMAQRASQNPSLIAFAIEAYVKQSETEWGQLARQWRLRPGQLAKLALCNRPRSSQFEQDADQIAAYAGTRSRTVRQFLQAIEPSLIKVQPAHSVFWQRVGEIMFGKQRFLAASPIALVFLLAVGLFVWAQPEQGTPATLVVSEGRAVVTQKGGAFANGSGGTIGVGAGEAVAVRAGDAIRLEANSVAQLRFFDGGFVELSESASLEITELLTNETRYRVRLTLLTGRTFNSVSRALGNRDTFEIRTPSSTASVRGTVFQVKVITSEWTYVACDEGVVRVAMGRETVDLRPNEEVNAIVGLPLYVQPQASPGEPSAPSLLPTDEPAPAPSPTEAELESPTGTPGDAPSGSPVLPSPAPPPLPTTPAGPPPQVPGNPPGNPGNPSGGGVPPGQGGQPPGQSRP